jgi:hypothetical protein
VVGDSCVSVGPGRGGAGEQIALAGKSWFVVQGCCKSVMQEAAQCSVHSAAHGHRAEKGDGDQPGQRRI